LQEKKNSFIYLFSFYKFHRRILSNNLKELPGISIIKPLTCIDGNLYENLKSFFNMKYPRVCVEKFYFILKILFILV